MRRLQLFLRMTGVVATVMIMTGCAYRAALQRLSPAEKAEFHAYYKVMSGPQAWRYLSRTTAAERTAYLKEIGLAARFQALPPEDREAVLAGIPREGMRADAIRFLWGEPYYTEGYANHYESWFYLGSSFTLAREGNDYSSRATMMEVQLIDGKMAWWFETVPDDEDDGSDDSSWD